jgi:hypothetical protein
MASVIKLQLLLIRHGIQLFIDTTENESLVHRARNVAVGRFMQETDADLFLFIDADVDFDPESVLRLVKGDHDVSCACYPKKCIMWDQVAKAIEAGDDRNPNMLASSLVLNFGAKSRPVQKFPELWCQNDHQNRTFDRYHACFDCMIDPDTKRYLSEDYAFCRRWQQMDGRIFADVHTSLGHVGNLPFSGCLNDRLKIMSA